MEGEAQELQPRPALRSKRFELRRVLGSGGMGDVFEALDRETQSTVAIKTLRHLDGESLYRFKNEFRALADLEHRNLVRYGELYCEGGSWYFTMELVRGVGFLRYVRTDAADGGGRTGERGASDRRDASDASTPTEATRTMDAPSGGGIPGRGPDAAQASAAYDESRLRDAARQLAIAIHVVHASGRVHRDIKQSNVLVSDTGRVVLLDFGLVDDARSVQLRWQHAGTPAYMAPEQAQGQPIGPEADWYAFGTLLFRALTGVFPFHAAGAAALLETKCSTDAPGVGELVDGAPADLVALCRDLLRRDGRERPSGREVLERLGAELGDADPGEHAHAHGAGPFVGRSRELDALSRALEDSGRGGTAAVLVRGEAGVGKSALVHHFLAAHTRAHVILRGRCYEQESVPLSAFDSVVDSLSQHLLGLPDERVEALLAGGAHFLAGVFPVLTRVPAVARLAPRARESVEATQRRLLAFRQLKSLLGAVAASAPLIVFIDDLQWADDDSLALLDDLLRPPDAPACQLIATMRPVDEADMPAALRPLLASFRALELSGLRDDQAEQLLGALWAGSGRGGREARERARALIVEARGHPLWITELARYVQAASPDVATLERLEDVLWRRIESLDASARRLMEVTALVGLPIDHRVVARAAGVEADECLGLLSRLRTAQLIRIGRRDGRRLIEPYHDRIREAVVARLGGADGTRALHQRIGRELLAHTPDDELDSVIFTVVSHLDRALDPGASADERLALARLQLRAARKAKLSTAYGAATAHLQRAVALLPDDVWSVEYPLAREVFTEATEVAYLAGRAEEGAARFEELLERLTSDAERLDLFILKIGIDTGQGRANEAIETARRAMPLCGEHVPSRVTNAHVLREYLAVRWRRGRRPAPALADLPEMTDPAARDAMRLYMAMSPAAYFVDSVLLSLVLLRMTNLSLRLGVCDVSAFGFGGYGLVRTAVFGDHADGHALGELSHALNERFGNTALASRLSFVSGTYLMPWVRPFSEARRRLQLACDQGRQYGDAAYEAYAAATLSVISLNEAWDLAAQQACAEHSREITSHRRDHGMTGMVTAHQRYYETMRGLTDDVLSLSSDESTDEAFRAELSEATPLALFYYHLLRAELHYLFGDPRDARRELAACAPWLPGVFGVPTAVEHALLQVLIAARCSDGAGWRERARSRRSMARPMRALARAARSCPANFAVQDLIARAERARVAGRAVQASALFEDAVSAARRHGAVKREALALELAAGHATALGDADRAAALRREAVAAYERWGAHARAEALRA